MPPRIERPKIAAELLAPCLVADSDYPVKATPRAMARLIVIIEGRLECANWKLEKIGEQVDVLSSP